MSGSRLPALDAYPFSIIKSRWVHQASEGIKFARNGREKTVKVAGSTTAIVDVDGAQLQSS